MERLTTDNPKNNLQTALNLFYAKDGEAWVRGGGPEYEYQDVPLFSYIRSVIQHQRISRHLWDELDNETLAEVLTEWLFDGHETTEGIIATLYTAAWAFAEIRARLKAYEDTGLMPEEVNKLDSQRKAMAALADSYKAEIPCWIPVSERLPEAGIEVLAMLQVNKFDGHDAHNVTTAVLMPSESWLVADYQEGIMAETSGTDCEDCCYWITHWMPLPMSPEEG